MDNLFKVDSFLDEYVYIGEMTTVATDRDLNMRIQVNPDRHRKAVPYFKVFNDTKMKTGETKVTRLHFLDTGKEFHNDGFVEWNISNKDIKNIIKFLNKPYKKSDRSNWDMAKWLWNLEYAFFDEDDEDKYFLGKFDDEFKYHPSYVPSTTKIPETWE